MAKTLTVKINGDASGLKGALDDADGSLGKWGSRIGTVAKGAGLAIGGLIAGGAALAPVVLSAGASMEALANKSATVFEDSLGSVQAWARENASALGMTASQLTGTAAGFADLLKPMGFTAAQAAEMSQQTMGLAGALSAWSGGTMTATEVSDTLAKAMLGETDGLKALGIAISAADVEARLAANGADKLTGAALEQAKALAVQQLIQEKSTDAQKAWADGSMDAIKQQNAMKASLENLKETGIKALYPVFQALIPVVSKAIAAVQQGISSFVGAFKFAEDGVTSSGLNGWIERFAILVRSVTDTVAEHWPTFRDIAVEVFTRVAEVVGSVISFVAEHWPEISATISAAFEWVRANVLPVVQATTQFIVDLVSMVIDFVQDHWAGISQTFEAVFAVVRWLVDNVLEPAIKVVVKVIENAVPVIRVAMEAIATVIAGVIDGVKWAIDNVFSPAFSAIGTTVATVIDGVKWYIDNVLSPAWELISSGAQTAYDLVSPILEDIGAAFSTMADTAEGAFKGVTSALKKAWNAVANSWNKSVGKISISIPGWVPEVGGKGFDMPDLPTLHTGGVVPGPAGTEVPILALAGETVFTEDQMDQLGGRMGAPLVGTLIVSDGRSIWSELRTIEALYGAAA